MTNRIVANLTLVFCLLFFVGCGDSGEKDKKGAESSGEATQSSNETKSWAPETKLPDAD